MCRAPEIYMSPSSATRVMARPPAVAESLEKGKTKSLELRPWPQGAGWDWAKVFSATSSNKLASSNCSTVSVRGEPGSAVSNPLVGSSSVCRPVFPPSSLPSTSLAANNIPDSAQLYFNQSYEQPFQPLLHQPCPSSSTVGSLGANEAMIPLYPPLMAQQQHQYPYQHQSQLQNEHQQVQFLSGAGEQHCQQQQQLNRQNLFLRLQQQRQFQQEQLQQQLNEQQRLQQLSWNLPTYASEYLSSVPLLPGSSPSFAASVQNFPYPPIVMDRRFEAPRSFSYSQGLGLPPAPGFPPPLACASRSGSQHPVERNLMERDLAQSEALMLAPHRPHLAMIASAHRSVSLPMPVSACSVPFIAAPVSAGALSPPLSALPDPNSQVAPNPAKRTHSWKSDVTQRASQSPSDHRDRVEPLNKWLLTLQQQHRQQQRQQGDDGEMEQQEEREKDNEDVDIKTVEDKEAHDREADTGALANRGPPDQSGKEYPHAVVAKPAEEHPDKHEYANAVVTKPADAAASNPLPSHLLAPGSSALPPWPPMTALLLRKFPPVSSHQEPKAIEEGKGGKEGGVPWGAKWHSMRDGEWKVEREAVPGSSNLIGSHKEPEDHELGEGSDDEDEAEAGLGEGQNAPADKKTRRMLSNRASAKRSRQRRQERLSALEVQAAKLRMENAQLARKYKEAVEGLLLCKQQNELLKKERHRLLRESEMLSGVRRSKGIDVEGMPEWMPRQQQITNNARPYPQEQEQQRLKQQQQQLLEQLQQLLQQQQLDQQQQLQQDEQQRASEIVSAVHSPFHQGAGRSLPPPAAGEIEGTEGATGGRAAHSPVLDKSSEECTTTLQESRKRSLAEAVLREAKKRRRAGAAPACGPDAVPAVVTRSMAGGGLVVPMDGGSASGEPWGKPRREDNTSGNITEDSVVCRHGSLSTSCSPLSEDTPAAAAMMTPPVATMTPPPRLISPAAVMTCEQTAGIDGGEGAASMQAGVHGFLNDVVLSNDEQPSNPLSCGGHDLLSLPPLGGSTRLSLETMAKQQQMQHQQQQLPQTACQLLDQGVNPAQWGQAFPMGDVKQQQQQELLLLQQQGMLSSLNAGQARGHKEDKPSSPFLGSASSAFGPALRRRSSLSGMSTLRQQQQLQQQQQQEFVEEQRLLDVSPVGIPADVNGSIDFGLCWLDDMDVPAPEC